MIKDFKGKVAVITGGASGLVLLLSGDVISYSLISIKKLLMKLPKSSKNSVQKCLP